MPKTSFYYENYNLEPDESSQKCCTKHHCLQFCKKFLHFMISRVGLMIVMIGYVLAGGLIFEALESDYENKALRLSENVLEKMLLRIYKQIENNSTRVKDLSFYHFLRYEIRNFSDFFTNATLNGTLTGHVDRQWDFFGSVFYCVTLVSTIGYGHITCKTNFGKAFTILYSAIGVPLMMLFLANIGSSTGALFRFFYVRIESMKRRYKMYQKKKKRELGIFGPNGDLIDSELFAEMAYENKSTYEMFINELALYNRSINLSQMDHQKGSLKRLSTKKSSPITTKKEKKTKNNKKNGSKDSETDKTKNEKDNSKTKNKEDDSSPKKSLLNRFGKKDKDAKETSKNSSNKSANNNNIINNKNISDENEAIKKIDCLLDQKSITDDELISNNNYNQEENSNMNDPTINNNNNFEMEDSHSINELNENVANDENDFEDDDYFLNNEYLVKNMFETQPAQDENVVSKTLNDTTTKTIKNDLDTTSLKKISISKSDLDLNETNKDHHNRLRLFGRSFVFKKNHKDGEHSPKPKSKSVSPMNRNNDSVKKDQDTEISNTMKAGLNKLISSEEENHYVNTNLVNNQISIQNQFNYNSNFNKPTRYIKRNSKIKTLPMYNKKQLSQLYRQYQHERNKKVGVPVLTILLIMICYLFAGMFIFSSLEKWSRLDAFYFCFTTLLTIGFGDLIPGSTLLNKNGNNNNLYISALYIFVGLVLIAMSLNLVNHQIKNKIKSVARKIGLTNC